MQTLDGGHQILKAPCTAIIVTMKDVYDSCDTPETFTLQLQFMSKNYGTHYFAGSLIFTICN